MELPNLAATLGRFVVVGLLSLLGLADLRWVAVGYVLAAIAGITTSWYVARAVTATARVFAPVLAHARWLLVHSLPFAVTGLATVVISRFDVLVLGLSRTTTEVGRYEPVLRIVEQAMLLVSLPFTAQFLPVAARAFRANDRASFEDIYVGISKLVYILSFPAVIALAAFPETILHALYGAGFAADGRVVWLLLVGFVVNLAFGFNSSALAASGDRRALARSGAVAIATMLLLALALIPPLGPDGAAVATSGTYVVYNLWVAVELVRVTGAQPLRADFVVALVTSVGPLLAALAVRARLPLAGLGQALGWSLGLAVLWVVLLLALRVVRAHELRRLFPGLR